ncbi:MAG TPA: hypothetical protein VGM66_03275 [Candidatus Udaeobacter sp.]|jgi:hypothetical protein
MIKKTTATYAFSFIFLANILSEAAKNVEVFPPLLRRIATNPSWEKPYAIAATTGPRIGMKAELMAL